MGLRQTLPGAREVHVWNVKLAASEATGDACFRSLSEDEGERIARYRDPELREIHTLARGVLRALLGRYLATDARQLRFAYGKRGKPRVADPETDLAFNLAHSERRAVYAFATGCELGVDVEAVRPVNDAEGIVRRFFSPAECAEWRALARAERDAAFFRCWTRKEAYIKALGDGLMLPLDGFQVSLRPGEPARLIRARGDAEAARRWTLVALTPGAGYAGALALAESGRQVRESPLLSADEAIAVEQGGGAFPAFVAQFGA